jgi:hypothetical protein
MHSVDHPEPDAGTPWSAGGEPNDRDVTASDYTDT